MKVKNKPRLLKAIADSVDSPWEFVEAIASLEGMTMAETAEQAGITKEQYDENKERFKLARSDEELQMVMTDFYQLIKENINK